MPTSSREAAQIAKAVNGKAPVKLMWTREDDIRSGKYRPMNVHRMTARINKGAIEAWGDRTAIQSIMEGTPFLPPGTPDFSSIEGSNDIAYDIPNISVDVHLVKNPVSVLWWRSVGHTHTAYAKEHFFDVAARKAGKDPVELRRDTARQASAPAGVLNLAVEKAAPCPPARRAALPCTTPSRPMSLKWPTSPSTPMARSTSIASSARSIAASSSTPTSCARRWKAASATASPPSSAKRSR